MPSFAPKSEPSSKHQTSPTSISGAEQLSGAFADELRRSFTCLNIVIHVLIAQGNMPDAAVADKSATTVLLDDADTSSRSVYTSGSTSTSEGYFNIFCIRTHNLFFR